MKRKLAVLLGMGLLFCRCAADLQVSEIKFLEGEEWWGGVVAFGERMPYVQPLEEFDLNRKNMNNQVSPLFLSNKGRYVWSDLPFRFSVGDRSLRISSDFEKVGVVEAGKSLRDAYLAACRKHFPPSGKLPEALFFTQPQYNTWIELMYNQNQEDILKYARDIIAKGFPPGVLMIDDNWQKYYGNYEFRPEKFSDPKAMVDELHGMGFKVMLWVCPFVSADSPEYRELSAKGYLLKSALPSKGYNLANKKRIGVPPAVVSWWNGQSACYDLTNPGAVEYVLSKLKGMQKDYGIDGFKLDGGDSQFYADDVISYKKDAIPVEHMEAWARIGLEFPVNEYRACWRMGGEALVQRLGDKNYSWKAVQTLIPQMGASGLLGYAYTCPDMIGGGNFRTFLNVDYKKLDQALIVRSAQVHAMMPMMQFSLAPWRVLDEEHLAMTRDAARLHEKMGAYILECARESAKTGEPIVRLMEYAFPGEGFERCKDQYMLGEKYLVTPVVTKVNEREVKLPKGKWKDDLGKVYEGGNSFSVEVPLGRVPYFERVE